MTDSDELFYSLERILSIIYCRSIATEYRLPVAVMYPALVKAYSAVVPRPMDLGTLLLRTFRRELDVKTFISDLKLVFANSLKFNESTNCGTVMQAISIHLDLFSAGLVEEILALPYALEKLDNPLYRFKNERQRRRNDRYRMCRNEPLNGFELKLLVEELEELEELSPAVFRPILIALLEEVQGILAANEDAPDRKASQSISQLMKPFQQACQVASSADPSTATFTDFVFMEGTSLRLSSVHSTFLEGLDNSIGLLLVCVQERLLRGNTISGIWAAPSTAVWAQPLDNPKNKSVWWPCFVLATGKNCGDYAMDPVMQHVNLQRMPVAMKRQLQKYRPKGAPLAMDSPLLREGNSLLDMEMEGLKLAEVTAEDILTGGVMCPEGFMLAEFFGTHDYGWIRADQSYPFTLRRRIIGSLPFEINDENIDLDGGQLEAVIPVECTRLCSAAFVKEATEAVYWMRRTRKHLSWSRSKDISFTEDRDLDSIPTLRELEVSLLIATDEILMVRTSAAHNSMANTSSSATSRKTSAPPPASVSVSVSTTINGSYPDVGEGGSF